MAKKSSAAEARQAAIWAKHSRYVEWEDTWRELGHVYEGDGPYLDGSALVAHPRELIYQKVGDGYDFSKPIGEKDKLKRRRALARYENFAATIIDTIVDHQYAKLPNRASGEGGSSSENTDPYLTWLDDVDGHGTHIDDWLKWHQTLACTYGHIAVAMSRTGGIPNPSSKAEQGPLAIRAYTPLDVYDWLAPDGKLVAVKLVEAVERKDLMTPDVTSVGADDTSELPNYQFRIIDQNGWALYDKHGIRKGRGDHGAGELPVVIMYAKRRARIPVIGRSLLRDPKVFRDHYNMTSELREMIRGQIFSMLHIGLGDNETVGEARGRLGDHAGIDTVVFTKGGAEFIAPPDGPAATIASQIESLERKIYRIVGLPWEGDSKDVESADSRKLKASDLRNTLAGQADEAERFEYQLAEVWYRMEYGAARGQELYDASKLSIRHPDEFYVQQILETVEEARESISLDLGPTAVAVIKKRSLPIVIRDLDAKTLEIITKEIDERSTRDENASQMMQEMGMIGAAQAVEGPGGAEAEPGKASPYEQAGGSVEPGQ